MVREGRRDTLKELLAAAVGEAACLEVKEARGDSKTFPGEEARGGLLFRGESGRATGVNANDARGESPLVEDLLPPACGESGRLTSDSRFRRLFSAVSASTRARSTSTLHEIITHMNLLKFRAVNTFTT